MSHAIGSHAQPCEYGKFVRRLTDELADKADRPQLLQDLLDDYFGDILHLSPFHLKEKSNTDRYFPCLVYVFIQIRLCVR